jgi:hypothetical protein
VRGVLDQRLLGALEALGLAAAGLDHGTLGRVEVLVAGDAADAGGLCGGGVDLLLLLSLGLASR